MSFSSLSELQDHDAEEGFHFIKPPRLSVIKKKRKKSRCSYEPIFSPFKLDDVGDIAMLYGNIPLILTQNKLCMDLSILNQLYRYEAIQTNNHKDSKLASISLKMRPDAQTLHWKDLKTKLTHSPAPSHQKIAKVIKKFVLSHKEALTQSISLYAKQIAFTNTSAHAHSTDQHRKAAQLDKDLMSNFPCIAFTSKLISRETHIQQIRINDQLLHALGYTSDSFASTVLSEGLPPIFPTHLSSHSDFVHSLFSDPLTAIHLSSYCTSQLPCTLLTKSGYVFDTTVRIYFIHRYATTDKKKDNGSKNDDAHSGDAHVDDSEDADVESVTYFTVDVEKRGEPYIPPSVKFPLVENREFMDLVIAKEIEIKHLLEKYYNYESFPKYLTLANTCKIKEFQMNPKI